MFGTFNFDMPTRAHQVQGGMATDEEQVSQSRCFFGKAYLLQQLAQMVSGLWAVGMHAEQVGIKTEKLNGDMVELLEWKEKQEDDAYSLLTNGKRQITNTPHSRSKSYHTKHVVRGLKTSSTLSKTHDE